jgi:hypothetical protein
VWAETARGEERKYKEKSVTEVKIKGKMHPCTGTEALYRPYGL